MNQSTGELLKVAAIVPAHNEEGRVGDVVQVLVSSGMFSQVVVVDDGSSDRTAMEAELAGATVLLISKNIGKASAMVRGVAATTTPVVCFFDADLLGLTVDHVRSVVSPVVRGELVMNVGLCDRNTVANWFARRLPLVSGQRALRRDVFESVPHHQMVGYGAEMAFDQYCRSNHQSIGVVVLKGLGFVRKIQKVGFFYGLVQYIRMILQLIVWLLMVKLTVRRSNKSKTRVDFS
ncbi:hypothetical protein A2480_00770 [Candidatus Uhrbacteria bacterium RIFOXYC2_FULL_47_19]|uniref:Glycosyltransferase 2-like domain-containing protein n=1 Tax=Candidatus Uhrbacteria bacterium RIFOXYC2_FULL_47_19 TaxID=1802424 RepID=A0A1F7WFQ9_9BACT|nr:MAG: hypothetical protein A2480_00770 [Candidatus Uhrbacteria bacterium RIFOXYC2_FULL_47_19]HCC22508.1 hypothetical protein [Candidatus Uhrbacteria bacterium]